MALSRPCLVLSAFYSILFGIQVVCTSIILAEIQAQKKYLQEQQYKYFRFTSQKGQQEVIDNYFAELQPVAIISLILSSLMFLFMITNLVSNMLGKGFCKDNTETIDNLTQASAILNFILFFFYVGGIQGNAQKAGSFYNNKIKGTSITLIITSLLGFFASFGIFMGYGSTGGWEMVEWLTSPNLWFYRNMARRKKSRRS